LFTLERKGEKRKKTHEANALVLHVRVHVTRILAAVSILRERTSVVGFSWKKERRRRRKKRRIRKNSHLNPNVDILLIGEKRLLIAKLSSTALQQGD